MNLRTLGLRDEFTAHARLLLEPGQFLARVVTVDRNAFRLRGEAGEWMAELSGRFRFSVAFSPDLPCVGDWVCAQPVAVERAIVQAVLPRRTCLQRKAPGNPIEVQLIAANLDAAFVVQSCAYDFNPRRLDRYLIACHEGGIPPTILLTKTDLLSEEAVDGLICDLRGQGITAPILPLSCANGTGLERWRALLEPGQTFALIGSSGVGKSTLLNQVRSQETMATQAVSATGEGTHTTTRRQLLLLDNGALLIDTPGMRELGLLGASTGLDESFSDIHALAGRCRFGNCSHRQEPGCAVRQALANQELSEERYRSYLKLQREIEHHDLSYVEKRRKDRDFGRHIKSILKHQSR